MNCKEKQSGRVSRRDFLRLSGLTIGGLVLARCAPASPAPATAEPTAVPEEQPTVVSEPAAAETVELTFWGWQGFVDKDQGILDKFVEKNPNIEVKFDNFEWNAFISILKTSMQAGNVADVVQPFGAWVIPYAKGGMLLEVPQEILTYSQARDIYFPTTLGGYVYEGKLYGFPHDLNQEYGSALGNLAMFEEAGVAWPPAWATWDDMITDAETLTKTADDGSITVAGLNFINPDNVGFLLLGGILEQGGDYFASDGRHFNFDTPETRNTIQLLVDVAQKYNIIDPVVYSGAGMGAPVGIWNEKNAISLTGVWVAGWGADYPNMRVGAALHPPLFGSDHVFAADAGWGLFVPKQTGKINEAWQLARYLGTDPEAVEMWIADSSIPALVEMMPKAVEMNPNLQVITDLLPKGRFIGDVTDRDKLFFEIWHPRIMEAMIGTKTVDEAAVTIHKEANAVVDAAA